MQPLARLIEGQKQLGQLIFVQVRSDESVHAVMSQPQKSTSELILLRSEVQEEDERGLP